MVGHRLTSCSAGRGKRRERWWVIDLHLVVQGEREVVIHRLTSCNGEICGGS